MENGTPMLKKLILVVLLAGCHKESGLDWEKNSNYEKPDLYNYHIDLYDVKDETGQKVVKCAKEVYSDESF